MVTILFIYLLAAPAPLCSAELPAFPISAAPDPISVNFPYPACLVSAEGTHWCCVYVNFMLSELCLLFKAVEAVIASNLISAQAPGAEQASEPVLQTVSEPSQPAGKWQLFPAESDISYLANTVIKWNKSDFQVNKPDFNCSNNGQDNRILISDAIHGKILECYSPSSSCNPPDPTQNFLSEPLQNESKQKRILPGWSLLSPLVKRELTDGMCGNSPAKVLWAVVLGNRSRTWIFIPDFLLHNIHGSLHETKGKVLTFCLQKPRVIHGFATLLLGMSSLGMRFAGSITFSIRLYSKQTHPLPWCLPIRQTTSR